MKSAFQQLVDEAAQTGKLDLSVRYNDDDLTQLLDAVQERGVSFAEINLASRNITDKGVKALAASPSAAALQQLNLDGAGVRDEGIRALALSRYVTVLRQLSLAKTQVGDDGVKALAACQNMTALRQLNLNGIRVRDEGLMALAASPHMTALQDLGLYNTRVGDQGLKALVGSPYLAALKRLALGGTRVGDEGVKALAASPRLSTFEELSFYDTKVGDDGVKALAMSPYVAALRSLTFRKTRLGDEGVIALAANRHLAALERLSLARTRVGDKGISALAISRTLTALKRLSLRETGVSDEGIKALAASRTLSALTELHLESARTTLPAELIERADAKAIFQHLRGREKGWPLAEIKLLVLGQGRVGKTHLVKWVSGDPLYYNPDQDPTHDVAESEITLQWPTELGDGPDKVRCRVWDFGGQPELHSTHQFFLGAQRCFYVLVLRADWPADGDEAEANRLSYWLRMIAHHGRHQDERAPVLIAVTHCDRKDSTSETAKAYQELITALQDAKNKGWYGARVVGEPIVGFGRSEQAQSVVRAPIAFEWSEHANGIRIPRMIRQDPPHQIACRELRTTIQKHLAEVPDIKSPYPPSFFAMKNDVEHAFSRSRHEGNGRGKEFFDRTGSWFGEVREEHGIDEGLAAGWLEIFNSLGVTHWVGARMDIKSGHNTELQNRVYNPAWVRRPVYKLIRLKGGIITRDEQRQQLNDFKFTDEQENSIFNLMKACRLAYDCEDPQYLGGLLIPDSLEPNPQSMRGEAPFMELEPVRLMARFMPEKAFLRLIAEWYERIKPDTLRHCFRNEVYFQWPNPGQKRSVPILARPVLSPSGGDEPCMEFYVATNDEEIRRKLIDKLEQVMERIFKSEHLYDCYIGFVDSSQRLKIDHWSDLTIAIFFDTRSGKMTYYAFPRRLVHNARVAPTKAQPLNLPGKKRWPPLFALYADEGVDGFVKAKRIIAKVNPTLPNREMANYLKTLMSELRGKLKALVECHEKGAMPFEAHADGYKAGCLIGRIEQDENGDSRFRLPQ